MVDAFICQVAGHGGTRHGGADWPPSLPQTLPATALDTSDAASTSATHSVGRRREIISTHRDEGVGLDLFLLGACVENTTEGLSSRLPRRGGG